MSKKTWNLTLTPEGAAPATVTGLSQSEMIRTVYDLMHGSTPEVRRTPAGSHEQQLAA